MSITIDAPLRRFSVDGVRAEAIEDVEVGAGDEILILTVKRIRQAMEEGRALAHGVTFLGGTGGNRVRRESGDYELTTGRDPKRGCDVLDVTRGDEVRRLPVPAIRAAFDDAIAMAGIVGPTAFEALNSPLH